MFLRCLRKTKSNSTNCIFFIISYSTIKVEIAFCVFTTFEYISSKLHHASTKSNKDISPVIITKNMFDPSMCGN